MRLVWHRLYNYDPGLVLTSLVAQAESAAADVFLSFVVVVVVVVVVAAAAASARGLGLVKEGVAECKDLSE